MVNSEFKLLINISGHRDVVKVLLDAKIDTLAVDSDGVTAKETTDDQKILDLF
jgi:hypothetical protein